MRSETLQKSYFRRILLSAGFVLLLFNILPANSNKIDSLKAIIKTSNSDSLSINTFLLLGQLTERLDCDSAISYYDKAESLARENNLQSKIASSLVNKGFAFFYGKKSKKSIDLVRQGLEMYISLNDSTSIFNTYYNLGFIYASFEDYSNAIYSFQKSEQIGEKLSNYKQLIGVYNNLGLMYYYTGQYDQANRYHCKSLVLSEKIGDDNSGFTHINMALNYCQQKNYAKSMEHNLLALDIFEKANNFNNIALCLKNIGDNYSDQELLDSAMYYYNKANVIYVELNDTVAIARYNMLLGIINQKKENYNKARNYYKIALNILPVTGSRKTKFAIYSNIIDLNLYLIINKIDSKREWLEANIIMGKEMLSIAKESSSLDMEVDSYERLYITYKFLSNWREALRYSDLYIKSNKLLFSEQKQKAISEIQTKYETEKKALEIEILNKENKLISTSLEQNKSMLRNQRLLIYLLVGGLILGSFFVFVIYRLYFRMRIANRKLISQNAIIFKQKEEKENLIQEIHHRVKNNLQIISSLLDLQIRNSDNLKTKTALIDGLNRVKSVGLIHQLLYQSEDVINIDFADFVSKLLNHITSYASDREINKKLDIPKRFKFDIATTIPLGLIITELLTNAIKYAFNDVEVCTISVNMEIVNSDQYRLVIIDNGSGLDSDFDFNSSRSLGLRLVRTLSKQISGNIDYEFENGAKFSLTFSKKTHHG